jgi:hypothetical protein
MKMKRGDIVSCELEGGCGLKVVVIEACGEVECDLKCCGKDMTIVKSAGPDAWKQFAKEADPEAWKKYAEGKEE